MKNKKLIIIIAAVVLLVAVAVVAVVISGVNSKDNDKKENDVGKDDNKVYVNLVDKYASSGMKGCIFVPDRASAEGDSYEKSEGDIKVYEKFTLTDDEAKKMNGLIASDNWYLMSEAKFDDPGARDYWKHILRDREVGIEYNAESTYYLIRNSHGNFIPTMQFMAATSCEIAIFDSESNAYYYIRYDT